MNLNQLRKKIYNNINKENDDIKKVLAWIKKKEKKIKQ